MIRKKSPESPNFIPFAADESPELVKKRYRSYSKSPGTDSRDSVANSADKDCDSLNDRQGSLADISEKFQGR